VAVSERDVRHIADLARLGLDPARIAQLVHELNGILAHMEVLSAVDTAVDAADDRPITPATPLREDGGTPVALEQPIPSFAPETADGFFLVPRLATHESPDAPDAP
jgi:aspartyl-tRNA(Asn)/glutamyl-tRNA(Gln) amidotransferase subunit C